VAEGNSIMVASWNSSATYCKKGSIQKIWW